METPKETAEKYSIESDELSRKIMAVITASGCNCAVGWMAVSHVLAASLVGDTTGESKQLFKKLVPYVKDQVRHMKGQIETGTPTTEPEKLRLQ